MLQREWMSHVNHVELVQDDLGSRFFLCEWNANKCHALSVGGAEKRPCVRRASVCGTVRSKPV